MAASTTRRSSGPILRSLSPCGRLYSSSSSGFASSSSSFSSRSTPFVYRSTSPTRVNLSPPSPSVRFSVENRPISPSRSISSSSHRNQVLNRSSKYPLTTQKRTMTCMCSPTSHPGSFRCSFHRNFSNNQAAAAASSSAYPSNRLNARRSAMTNSLVRIGTVEGDLMKRALASLIRPSSHQQRRRTSFQPTPSRLSVSS